MPGTNAKCCCDVEPVEGCWVRYVTSCACPGDPLLEEVRWVPCSLAENCLIFRDVSINPVSDEPLCFVRTATQVSELSPSARLLERRPPIGSCFEDCKSCCDDEEPAPCNFELCKRLCCCPVSSVLLEVDLKACVTNCVDQCLYDPSFELSFSVTIPLPPEEDCDFEVWQPFGQFPNSSLAFTRAGCSGSASCESNLTPSGAFFRNWSLTCFCALPGEGLYPNAGDGTSTYCGFVVNLTFVTNESTSFSAEFVLYPASELASPGDGPLCPIGTYVLSGPAINGLSVPQRSIECSPGFQVDQGDWTLTGTVTVS